MIRRESLTKKDKEIVSGCRGFREGSSFDRVTSAAVKRKGASEGDVSKAGCDSQLVENGAFCGNGSFRCEGGRGLEKKDRGLYNEAWVVCRMSNIVGNLI